MTTKETVQGYLDALKQKGAWQSFFADDVVFLSMTSPVRQVNGKAAFLESAKGFYGMIGSMAIKEVIADGERACALTHYQLRPPVGNPFDSDVAEIFTVKNGKITSFAIYFDLTPYPKPGAPKQ